MVVREAIVEVVVTAWRWCLSHHPLRCDPRRLQQLDAEALVPLTYMPRQAQHDHLHSSTTPNGMNAGMRLYDLAGADEQARFSPNCWRVRLALAHKQLAVETLPWRFTEQDAIAFSGQSKVPVLVDGDRCVVDSWVIAEYLEDTYADRPSLFGGPVGRSLARFVNQWANQILHPAIARVIVPDLAMLLHPKDQGYFRATREAAFGITFEALATAREENLAALQRVLQPLSSTLAQQDFLAGTAPAYADHVAFGAFQWARVSSPIAVVASDDPIAAWCQRMLDAYGGLARATRAAAATSTSRHQEERTMDTTTKLLPGQTFSPETFKRLDGPDYTFGTPGHWQALFVFRGQHCPVCKSYLVQIEAQREAFEKMGIAIAAVSADSEDQTRVTAAASHPGFPLLYGMDLATMQRLGFYISEPRSEKETDHRFAEPALLVVNADGVLQIVDITNAPFVRPGLDMLVNGLGFVMEKNYPVRGTHR